MRATLPLKHWPIPPCDNASLVTSGTLFKDALQTGTNRLSVEVHQATDQSSDLVFAASLSALTELTPEIQGRP